MAYIKKEDKLRILVLEDSSERIQFFKSKLKDHDVYYFDTAEDAIQALQLIKDKPWDMIFLDHDLGGKVFVSSSDPNTGYAVAKYIAENDVDTKQIVIHSLNPAGAGNMKQLLPEANIIPFTMLKMRL